MLSTQVISCECVKQNCIWDEPIRIQLKLYACVNVCATALYKQYPVKIKRQFLWKRTGNPYTFPCLKSPHRQWRHQYPWYINLLKCWFFRCCVNQLDSSLQFTGLAYRNFTLIGSGSIHKTCLALWKTCNHRGKVNHFGEMCPSTTATQGAEESPWNWQL